MRWKRLIEKKTYFDLPIAQQYYAEKSVDLNEIKAACFTAEGYSFPTNLDSDPPKGGLAPETQQAFHASS